jgi:nucleotide-binding universal stress UspA family protein
MADQPRLLICYDESTGGRHALVEAGRIFPGARATVVYVSKSPRPLLVGGVTSGQGAVVDPEVEGATGDEIYAEATRRADELAESTRSEAYGVGLEAEVEVRQTAGAVWRELLDAADEYNADVIVAGARGHGEVRALLLGSTAEAIAHHSKRPVLIIRSPTDD